jgi:hypothetical protein
MVIPHDLSYNIIREKSYGGSLLKVSFLIAPLSQKVTLSNDFCLTLKLEKHDTYLMFSFSCQKQ